MDLYVVGPDFMKEEVIDEFSSLIWTERYNAAGDITLQLPKNNPYKSVLKEGVLLSIRGSREMMRIDSVSIENGITTLTGMTLVGFLKERILRNTWSAAKDSWSLTGFPGEIAGQIVTDMCIVTGLMDTGVVVPDGNLEVIPNLNIGDLDENGSVTTVAVPFGNVYDGVKMVCDLNDLGFTMYPEPPNVLIFTTYAGLDRTSNQDTNPVVVFSPALESLANIKELRSIAGYITTVYVWPSGITSQSQIGVATVPGTDAFTGFDRRTLMVTASDVAVADYTSGELAAILNRRAKNELVNNNYVRMVDGQLVPQNAFKYGVDYTLGDIIELRNETDTPDQARITEYIRSQDASGETSYPTLSVI